MKLKKIHLFAFTLILFTGTYKAQINAYAVPTNEAVNTNYFMDASLYEGLSNASKGKLLGFPGANLASFTFDNALQNDGKASASFYDGVLIYNNNANGILNNSITLTRGFYYFNNPTAGNTNSGEWVRLGGTNYTSSEKVTDNSIDGKPIYSQKGTFVADGTDTQYTLTVPTGITGVYRVTIYNTATNYYSNSVYSISTSSTSTSAALVTGSPRVSAVYPAGTYTYILEYLK